MFKTTHGTWGERLCTFRFESGIVTLLFLKPWNRCSWHSHKKTWNQFTCVTGELGVKTDKGYTTHLKPGQSFTVEPGVKHEFQIYYEPTIVEEIAYVEFDEIDIDREELGGKLNKDEHQTRGNL